MTELNRLTEKAAAASKLLPWVITARRICVVANRVTKHVEDDPEPGRRRRRRHVVPTDRFVLTVFQGGSIDLQDQEQAESLAKALTQVLHDALAPYAARWLKEASSNVRGDIPLSVAKAVEDNCLSILGITRLGWLVSKRNAYTVHCCQDCVVELAGDAREESKLVEAVNAGIRALVEPYLLPVEQQIRGILDER